MTSRSTATAVRRALLAMLVAAPVGATAAPAETTPTAATLTYARFGDARPAGDVRLVADWVARSRDHEGVPFIVIDKRNAQLYVFDGDAALVSSTPVLLGAAVGDDSVPGIGERKISEILPHERTTPAGRFLGERGRNLKGEGIVWVDYDAAVSMHRVRANDPTERRLQRLASKTSADNRISYGCINVPAAFFDAHVWPVFEAGRKAMIYVMPETRGPEQVFPALRFQQGAQSRNASRG